MQPARLERSLNLREYRNEKAPFLEETAPAVRLQKEILAEAVDLGASDVHLEPWTKEVQVRYRVDGLLIPGPVLPKSLQESLVSRFKITCNLNISEKRNPQDGSFHLVIQGKPLDLRVSCLPTLWGEKVVIRLLGDSRGFLTLDQLGIPTRSLQRLTAMVERSQGMILVVGPTGSGKSTTLYSLLRSIHRPGINIVSIEDPVEYLLEGINQVQVNEKIGLTFASVLRSVLRQDPDVIMVGEIRDEETAQIAFRAAMTGHLVLSTLHTNDTVSTITRLADLGLPPYLISSSLLGILAQRLVRRNCPHCLTPYQPDPEFLERVHLTGSAQTFFRGRGCPECRGQGVTGREGVYELLTITPVVREALLSRTSENDLRYLAAQEELEPLLERALQKAGNGLISLEELLRVVPYEVGVRCCAHCLYPLEHFYLYCPQCARSLVQRCRGCGKRLRKNWRVCPYCGGEAV
jgi:type II secretory ATPase GspE/PulE/Tfp pilus assembly ATPase PilB-like protein